jgi:hypothetical protein
VHPERYDEILAEYTPRAASPLLESRVQRPKPLEPRHASETYRAVWESLILEPPSGDTIALRARGTARDALVSIRDDRSIPVIVHALTAACGDRVPPVGETSHRQVLLLQTLGRFMTRRALDGMLEALSRCDGAKAFSGHTLREWAFRSLTDQENFGNREAWLEVLKSYPKGNLSGEDRKLLEQAIAFEPPR